MPEPYEDGVKQLIRANFVLLPFVTLLVLAYIFMSPLWFGILNFFGRRIHKTIRRVWRVTWLLCNSATFGCTCFYLSRFCKGDVPIESMCTNLRPLETQTCHLTATLTAMILLVALFADRVILPLVAKDTTIDAYDYSRTQRIALGGSLLVAWGGLSDLDSVSVVLLFGLSARRALEPILPWQMMRPCVWCFKAFVVCACIQTLRNACVMLTKRLVVGSVLGVLMW